MIIAKNIELNLHLIVCTNIPFLDAVLMACLLKIMKRMIEIDLSHYLKKENKEASHKFDIFEIDEFLNTILLLYFYYNFKIHC